MCWKVIQERPQHSFSINVTQNICKSALLRAVVGVPSGELSNNGQKRFPLLYDGELEPWPPAITVYGRQLRRNVRARGQMQKHTHRFDLQSSLMFLLKRQDNLAPWCVLSIWSKAKEWGVKVKKPQRQQTCWKRRVRYTITAWNDLLRPVECSFSTAQRAAKWKVSLRLSPLAHTHTHKNSYFFTRLWATYHGRSRLRPYAEPAGAGSWQL